MAEKVDATFQEVFSEMSSTDSVRLLPWCISTAANPGMIPIHYMSEALTTTVQQRMDAPVATTALGSEGSQALASTNNPAHQTGTPPLPFFPCHTFYLSAFPQLGVHLSGLSSIPSTKSRITSPTVHLMIDLGRGPWPKLQTEADVSSGHNTSQGNRELPETPSEICDSENNTDYCGDKSNQAKLRENVADSNLESACWDCLTCLDTKEMAIKTA